jgi:hypothetical protein
VWRLCSVRYMDIAYYVDLADGPRLSPSDDASGAGTSGPEKGSVPRAVLCPVFSDKRCDPWFYAYPLFYFFADVPAAKLIGPFANTHLLVVCIPRNVASPLFCSCRNTERAAWRDYGQ